MEKNKEKFILSLDRARESLKTADHLAYMTFQVVNDNKILLKVLENIYDSIKNIINAILQYEYLHKNIKIYKDPAENFKTFKRLSQKYNIAEKQLEKITKILKTAKEHKNSPFEFSKKDKLIIMSDNKKAKILDISSIKEYILENKDLLRKASIKLEN